MLGLVIVEDISEREQVKDCLLFASRSVADTISRYVGDAISRPHRQ